MFLPVRWLVGRLLLSPPPDPRSLVGGSKESVRNRGLLLVETGVQSIGLSAPVDVTVKESTD